MEVFTTTQVAKICGVSPLTVSKWFDSGLLKGYRIPGSRHRRIQGKHLINFMKDNGMPLDGLVKFIGKRGMDLGYLGDQTKRKVLVVSQDKLLVENMGRKFTSNSFLEVVVATSSFEAGIECKSCCRNFVIVDFSIGEHGAVQILQNIRRNSEFADATLVALLPSDGSCGNFDRSLVNMVFTKPFDVRVLAEYMRGLITV